MLDFFHHCIRELLQFVFCLLFLILGNFFFLLKIPEALDDFTADVADGNAAFLKASIDHLHQFTPALFREGGEIQADGFTIVIGG